MRTITIDEMTYDLDKVVSWGKKWSNFEPGVDDEFKPIIERLYRFFVTFVNNEEIRLNPEDENDAELIKRWKEALTND